MSKKATFLLLLSLLPLSNARAADATLDQLQARLTAVENELLNQKQNKVPVGTILPFAGLGVPSRYLVADGKVLDDRRDPQFLALCAVIRDQFKAPSDTAGTCRLPDLRGRAAIGEGFGGVDAKGSPLTNRIAGEQLGEESHFLSIAELPSHNHGGVTGADYPDHSHGYQFTNGGSWGGGSGSLVSMGGASTPQTGGASTRHQHAIGAEGGNASHNVMQPSLVVKYVVKY